MVGNSLLLQSLFHDFNSRISPSIPTKIALRPGNTAGFTVRLYDFQIGEPVGEHS
jgi:hypothetical protein